MSLALDQPSGWPGWLVALLGERPASAFSAENGVELLRGRRAPVVCVAETA